ncbi:MAG: AAA family ATPase, partial [Oscillospiraceae bacterium]|nr:AAA family ATPase [Oscillospiraceae bacterium]
ARMVGQQQAVTAVAKAVRRGRVGLKEERRPVGCFLFLGPTGVGKTELCRALAQALFGSAESLLRFDMSEYMEAHTVSRLIGSPPGYVGHEEGGQLTEQVRRRPYSVVLFDEIEKAHQDVWALLLQIMEDGVLTDAQGRKADFSNAVVVMTSNVGAARITAKGGRLGFSSAAGGALRAPEELKQLVMEEVRRTFRPEFLNRLDELIIFHQLDQGQIVQIARRMLEETGYRLDKLGIRLTVSDAAVDRLAQEGFDPAYGARPLRRIIRAQVEDRLAELLLQGELTRGGQAQVDCQEEEIVIKSKREEQPA